MRQYPLVILAVFALSQSSYGADLPIKTLAAPTSYDWTGYYVGTHLDYQTGQSRWSEGQSGAVGARGAFDVGQGYDFSSGTGSYAIGFQGRYDYMDASHHVFGVEGDIWFPNTLRGSQTFNAAVGSASYSETVQFSGTLRGRLGYAAGNWLFYLTGGFAGALTNFAAAKSRARPP